MPMSATSGASTTGGLTVPMSAVSGTSTTGGLTVPMSAASGTLATGGLTTLMSAASGTSATGGLTMPRSATAHILSPHAVHFVPSTTTSGSLDATSRLPATTSVPSEDVSGTEGVMETFTQLLKAQTNVMAAQAEAVAIQNLPTLSRYTGEGVDTSDDGFDRWLESFQERAKFADCSEEEQLYQLKLYLDITALDVFRMLPDNERQTVALAISVLRKRFKPADIEELHAWTSLRVSP